MGGIFSRRQRRHRKKLNQQYNNEEINVASCVNNYPTSSNNVTSTSNSNRESIDEICPDRQPKLLKNRCILDMPNYDFRIEPLEQSGNKVSDTHYFLINEPNRYVRCHSTKERYNPIEMYANSSRMFNGAKNSDEPPLPYDLNQHFDTRNYFSNFCNTNHSSLPIKRGRSDSTDYLYNNKRALIARMRLKIPQANDVESHGVLMGTNWNFDEAERRLKMELVHRENGANYKECESLLASHNWDLNKTLENIKHHQNELGEQHSSFAHSHYPMNSSHFVAMSYSSCTNNNPLFLHNSSCTNFKNF